MSDLWNLIWGKPELDPAALARAIECQGDEEPLDERTKMLICDGTRALELYWGTARFAAWINQSSIRTIVQTIQAEHHGKSGFPSLGSRLVERTDPETIREFLRELGTHILKPVSLNIGGSIALILDGYVSRATEAIDIVDEVPVDVRLQYDLLAELTKRYGIHLAHFQSHYLPFGWDKRLQSKGKFGLLEVFVVDVYDIFLGKLFSARKKDLDDLRAMKSKISKETLVERFRSTTMQLQDSGALKAHAENNWYILFGEKLPL